ncbi:glycosyltransferase family 32 protein [Planoprotostelium fungivorum]|uniref:Glycosyltransferase family 32 protein n=1 Tax=Planoprotostelium fungivorum TaxID=1890364 RepID=A0A2P6NR84_9EUKA|nr:glycosyltransferase family 32 protein [Planoprotostelium fungivorum]
MGPRSLEIPESSGYNRIEVHCRSIRGCAAEDSGTSHRPANRLLNDVFNIPNIIHQSWKDERLPKKFRQWSHTWQIHNPHWTRYLWTDHDNDALCRRHFPWFHDKYLSLQGEIYRADVVRNMYLYLYGGVYSDLDVECLKPVDDLLDIIQSKRDDTYFSSQTPPASFSSNSSSVIILGQMEGAERGKHSIPNAWMASSPGHPFWLFMLFNALKTSSENKEPEEKQFTKDASRLYRDIRAAGVDVPSHIGETMQHDVIILSPHIVFPYSWMRTSTRDEVSKRCAFGMNTFDDKMCKDMLDLKKSHFITYWSHSWTKNGQSEESIKKLS